MLGGYEPEKIGQGRSPAEQWSWLYSTLVACGVDRMDEAQFGLQLASLLQ